MIKVLKWKQIKLLNHEKTNSSFKDDKSTKMEIDKITNMQSYSET